jgi:xylan 1,4-beta-xylosidase
MENVMQRQYPDRQDIQTDCRDFQPTERSVFLEKRCYLSIQRRSDSWKDAMTGKKRSTRRIKVTVDAGSPIGSFRHNWNLIGYDEINYTTTPNGQYTIRELGDLADAPYSIRAHHLLCTGSSLGSFKWGSTNAYTEDDSGNPVYHWKIIDEIFDTYLENNCKPFVELGFMPMDLSDNRISESCYERFGRTRHWQYYRTVGWSCPPKDYRRWYELVYRLVRHCLNRYGAVEAAAWYWELWNEPDLAYYWSGSLEEYCKLYDYTVAAVEAAFPEAQIGGPGTTGPSLEGKSAQWLEGFLDHCTAGTNSFTGKKGTRLDFISFHAKGARYTPGIQAEKQLPSLKRLIGQVKLGLEIIGRYPSLKGKKCILSECDPDGMAAFGMWDNMNLEFRNTEYYPAYVIAAFRKLADLAEQYGRQIDVLTWAFMFEGERCFEGTRALTTQGIDKPILNLFRMLSHLGTRRLELKSTGRQDPLSYPDDWGTHEKPDIDGFATLSDNKVQILLYSHHDDWDISGDYEVDLEVSGIPFEGSKATLSHFRLDGNHSNAYTEWLRRDRPKYPEGEDLEAIKGRESLELFEPESTVRLQKGTWQTIVSIPVNGISLLILSCPSLR